MKDEWKEIYIKDIGRVVTGNTPPRKRPELYGSHTIFIKPTDITKDKKYCYESEEYYSLEGFEKYKKSLIPKDSTCVVTIGSIGEKIIIAHEDLFLNQAMNAVIPNENFDKHFIYYLLKFNLFQLKTFDSGTASGRENVSKSSFSNIKVSCPVSKSTQQKIANILSAYDDLIENNTKRIELLEEQAQLIYEEWFVRMRFPNHKNTQIDAETGLPEGWTETRLKNLGQIITGKTPSTINTALYNGDIPFIKTPDMGELPYVIQTNSYLSKEGALSQKNKFLPKNSLLVSCIGTAGVCALTSRESQCNQQINAIKFDSENMTFFTYCFAKNLKPHLEALGSNGATMTNVNKNKFENIKIITPSLQLLNMFHEKVSLNFEVILLLIKQNQKLKEARDILLPRLMMGIIEV